MASEQTVPRQRRGHGRVTLEDVAQVAGVTSITVSRYLREPALVALETAERVRTALRETGYVPNKQAGQLASGRSNLVAALVPSVAQTIFAETVQGLSDALQAAGFELLLASTHYSIEREEDQLRALLGWFPSAVVVTGRQHSYGALKLLRAARAAGTPVIQIWDHPADGSDDGFTQIGFDHEAVGRAMAEHLLARGHRRLAYVDSGVVEDYRAHERGAGFAAAARAAAASAEWLHASDGDAFDAGRLMLRALRDGHPEVSAAAFASDHLACGALLEAKVRGVEVPGQLALLGFGDLVTGRQLAPALSTVAPPRYEIGHEAGLSLLAALRGDTTALGHRALPWQLMARGTT
jgi:LacI family transcriptional regulator, gluconate utilization system Gnt-I transcriptional repressor